MSSCNILQIVNNVRHGEVKFYAKDGQTCCMYEPRIVKTKLQRATTQKSKTQIYLQSRFCDIKIIFGTTCKSNTARHAS